jgi:hypothetical protein
VQLLHHPRKFHEFFIDFLEMMFFFAHPFSPSCMLGVKGFHCFLAKPGSHFRHRGERRRLRKTEKQFSAACGLAFNLSPPYCIVRLKMLYAYKNITE